MLNHGHPRTRHRHCRQGARRPQWTFKRLRAEGFSKAVLDGVRGVTKRKGEKYDAFVRRAIEHPVSREVKRADLIDNMDMTRLKAVTARDKKRLEKYRKALAMIDGS